MSSSKKVKRNRSQGIDNGTIASRTAGDWPEALLLIIFVVVMILLVGAPLFRGLYFPRELFVVHLVSFALFALWWIVKLLRKEHGFPVTLLDICILILSFFYFASTFWAINTRAAVSEFLKMVNYVVVYLLVFDLCHSLKMGRLRTFKVTDVELDRDTDIPVTVQALLMVMVFSGVVAACAGLAAASGADIKGAFVWGRLFSTLQYANAAAVYFLASMFLAVGMFAASERRCLRMLYIVSAIILFISTILTYSRSALLLIPVLVVLFAAVAGRGNRLSLLLYFSVIFAVGLPASFASHRFFLVGSFLAAWATIAAALVLGLLLAALVELYLSRLSPVGKAVVAVAVLFTICLASFLWFQKEIHNPLCLETAAGAPSAEQYMEQIVSGIQGNETYHLSLEAMTEGQPVMDEGFFAWRLTVLGIVSDKFSYEYLISEILECFEPGAGEWQEREFVFTTPGDICGLNICLISGYPGTKATFRNVVLRGGGVERPLGFNAFRILPAGLYQRLGLFPVDLAGEMRVAHYRDALQIIRDNPIWGYGGGAWNWLYPGYMKKYYCTTEPHNHYLKVWLEAGLFAFLGFIGAGLATTVSFLGFIRRGKGSTKSRLVAVTVYVALFGLLLHAAVDFSLSLGSVSLLLFALLGVGRCLTAELKPNKHEANNKKLLKQGVTIAGLAVSLLLICYTFLLCQGYRISIAAVSAYNQQSYLQAEALLRKATEFDPQQALNYSLLSDIYKHKAEAATDPGGAVRLMAKALDLAHQAWVREPYNTTYNRKYGLILLNVGEMEEGLQRLERNVELNPFHPDHYAQLAAAWLAAAEYYLNANETERAGSFLGQVLGLEAQMGRYHKSTAELDYYLGIACYMMQDLVRAIAYFSEIDAGSPHYGEAQQWIALLTDQNN